MKYLRSVRVDENDARDSEMLRRRGFLDPTGPKGIGKAVNIQMKLGNTKKAEQLKRQGRKAKLALRTPLARASTAEARYTLAGVKPENSSVIPLTLPNIMEINIVKGSDGKPVVASGKGTRLKNIAQPTEAALKRRRAGTQHAGSERLLKSKQASDRRTALIKRGRGEEARQVPSPPASTDGIGGNRPGGDAGTGEAIRHRIASRGHTR